MATLKEAFGRRDTPDRRAVELEQQFLADAPLSGNNTRPASDPLGTRSRTRGNFNQSGFLVLGRVVDAIAYARVYKVQCDQGLGTQRCYDSLATGAGFFGPRQLNTYPIGTAVLVFYHPQALSHVIVCGLPDWSVSAVDGMSDFIVQGSNCGVQVDAAHRFPFTLSNNGLCDFSAGRPADSVQAGEYGAITELGLRIFMDSMQIQVAVDETTGLVLCYMDQYARLSGYNFDLRTAGYNREDRDDQGEFSSVEEVSPYLWETLGLYGSSDVPFDAMSADDCQQVDPFRSRLEPVNDRQLGIYRYRRFTGYLGQANKTQTGVAVNDADEEVHTFDSDANSMIGLAEENTALDGGLSFRSARGVIIAKMPLIPAPKRAQRPESNAGDRADADYASCGIEGVGPAHHVAPAPTNGNSDPHVIEPAMIFDLLAYDFNWKGLHPFHYHAKDWYLAEETDMDDVDSMAVPDFASLATTTFLPQATSFSVNVDDRYGDVDYYANISCFALLPNGGIEQLDGWGAEQRSSGGTQYFFAPGDIVLGAGRRIILMAGTDVIIKGQQCVDLSATNGSLRVEAHENVQIMGGNNDCGGVLIESRSSQAAFELSATPDDTEDVIGGIVLRAKNSAIVAAGQQITLSTAMWGAAADNHIVIDAGDLANIVTSSGQFNRHIAVCGLDILGDLSGTYAINEFWPATTRLDSTLTVTGESAFLHDVVALADVIVSGVMAPNAYGRPSSSQISQMASLHASISSRDLSGLAADSATQTTWLADHSDLADLEFYFRSTAFCGADDFAIYEPVWAQLARTGLGSVPAVWTENQVAGDSHPDSMPWPGLTRWQTDDAYAHTLLSLFDSVTMLARDRGALYETAAIAAPTFVTLDGNWPIIN